MYREINILHVLFGNINNSIGLEGRAYRMIGDVHHSIARVKVKDHACVR